MDLCILAPGLTHLLCRGPTHPQVSIKIRSSTFQTSTFQNLQLSLVSLQGPTWSWTRYNLQYLEVASPVTQVCCSPFLVQPFHLSCTCCLGTLCPLLSVRISVTPPLPRALSQDACLLPALRGDTDNTLHTHGARLGSHIHGTPATPSDQQVIFSQESL